MRFHTFLVASALVACGGEPKTIEAPSSADALVSHARAQDDEGLRLAVIAVHDPSLETRMRGLAAMLEYEPAKLAAHFDLLGDRLAHGASPEEKAAAAWALVHAGDLRVAFAALSLFSAGNLEHVKKLDGSAGFDLAQFASMLAISAAPADLADARRKVLASAIPSADGKTRVLLVRALTEDDADGAVLVTAALALDAQKDFPVLEHLFQRLRVLADPRAADALARYADHASHPHFRTEAALRLAELGDLRAAGHLAWRLGEDPTKLYDVSDPNALAFARDDHERVTCARMLGELALMHPEARVQLRETVEQPVTTWMHQHPQPHANALRLLAIVESPQAVALLRKLADPTEPIPSAGALSFPPAFAVAQSALRHLGRTRDAASWTLLEKQLTRKPASFDGSMDSVMQGGVAMAAMTYRGLTSGAAEGFSEWGDVKAVPLLIKVAEDPKQNEQARVAACTAAAWLAEGAARRDLVAKVRATGIDRKRELVRSCWLIGLAQRPNEKEDASLAAVIVPKMDPESRHQTARILGEGGLAAPERAKLVDMLKDKALVHDAALALLFGGDDASLAKVFAAYDTPPLTEGANVDDAPPAPPIEPLRQLYAQSVPTLTEGVVESGTLSRLATLALAARNLTVHGAKQEWVLQGLAYQLRQSAEIDSGPHSLTRVRLRYKLLADARSSDAKKQSDAMLLLWVLGERASLESLGAIAQSRLAEPSP